MIKKFFIFLIFPVSLILLSGCEPVVFGVPQSTWNQLTPQQQVQIIQSYNQRKMIEAQNAPIVSAIDAAGKILKSSNDS